MATSMRPLVEDRLVQVAAGPVTLEGNLTLPEGARGVVLFAHGSGSSRLSPRNRYVARVLNEAKLATLLIDLLTPREAAIDQQSGHLRFDMGPETLARTALGDLGSGDTVNLERPMRLGGLVGGHLVQGHVDGVGLVVDLARQAETARLTIEWRDQALAPLLIPQGSVAVDGVSLTVARLNARDFEIMIIPHTLAATTLGGLRKGQRVNLEMDMIGKYVQRILAVRGDAP